jgi:L-malate glycosyltransferase
MRVLIIIDLSKSKSATLPDRNLVKGLHSKGVDLTVITHYNNFESDDLESTGIKLIYQRITKKIDPFAIWKIRSLLKSEKYDILHFMYSKAITNGVIASWGFNVKIIGYIGSLSVHWHDPFSYVSFLNHRIDKLICVSDGVKEHVLKQLPARLGKKVVRIYKGADSDWFKDVIPASRKDLGIPENAFVICCVANIRKIKGLKWLIEAANFLPENLPIWFLLVGDKSDSKDVRRKIRKTKYPDNFVTTGYSDDPPYYTAACDLYIQPSVSEGLGRSVIEAMCLRKPVIVTDRGGAKELVTEGINGYVVPAKSAKALAEIIASCYTIRKMLPEMGDKAKETIQNNFNHSSTVENTFNLYLDLLKETM